MSDLRTEVFRLEIEYEVLEEAHLDRDKLREILFDNLPPMIPDPLDACEEGARLLGVTDMN